jgi:lipopolysaccharide export system permease protein
MRVLDRYLIRAICGHFTLILAVLAVLLGLFLYINEQGWVGVGRYGQAEALRHVLLNLPATLLQFLPVAALLGAMLGLGQLARGSELTVMRAAGMSIARLCGAVLLAALLLLPLAVALGEWLGPPLASYARVTRAVERNGEISLAPRGGAWLRDGERILRADGAPGGAGAITVFEFSGPQQLAAVGRAAGARPAPEGGWELPGYAGSRFTAQGVEPGAAAPQRLTLADGADFFSVADANPRELSLAALARAVRYLEANQQDSHRYRFAFWAGIARLAAVPLAMLLAVPFLFGSMRSAETGARAMLGLGLGLGWFIVQRMVESGAIAFGLPPLLLAFLPTLLLGLAVLWLLRGAGRI